MARGNQRFTDTLNIRLSTFCRGIGRQRIESSVVDDTQSPVDTKQLEGEIRGTSKDFLLCI